MAAKDDGAILILHFGELWLRGRNRDKYIKQLKRNIAIQLEGEYYQLVDVYDRILIKLSKKSDAASITSKASKIFGISAYELAYGTKPDVRSITALCVKMLKASKIKSVKITSHRSYKEFKFNSIDIVKSVLGAVKKIGVEPRLEDFDKEIYISVTKERAYVHIGKNRGAGGLPVGSSGRCVILFSGGIDSPVAAYYAMKRGLEPVYIHVHGFSTNKEAMNSKIKRLTGILSAYYPRFKTYYVPSHVFQMSAIRSGRYELVLIKAFMMRLAEKIARLENAGAVYTGESLGQVASQTLPNIAAEQEGLAIPVLRPLIGFDKEEITKIARTIGTYDESTKPYKDVCSITVKGPVTNSNLETFNRLVKEVKLDAVVARSIKEAASVEAPSAKS